MNRPVLWGQHKKGSLKQEYKFLSNILAPQFQRRQFCFGLDALVVVEINVIINEFSRFSKSGNLCAVNTLGFENGKEIFSQSIVVRITAS